MCWGGPVDAVEIARCFGLGGPVKLSDGPVTRGKQGLVWRLDTTDGAWAVKVPLCPVGEEEVRVSTGFQEAAHAAGIPTPQVRRTTDGRVLATVSGRRLRLYEWVDLSPPDPLLDPAQVGAVVAAAHGVSLPGAGTLDPWYVEPVGAERWDRLVDRLREAGAPFVERLAGLRDELVELETWTEGPETLRICHRDLWADNLRATTDGGICVIDWESSGPADPAQELACVIFEFARTDPARARALVCAYRDAGGPASLDRPGHFTMLIAQLGHITESAAMDWLGPSPRSPDRADSAAWVSEVLDEPHTRDLLESLLAAARQAWAPCGGPG
jgi:Ser/Thr protein kinase RdoA (MazF antagonist)